MARISIPLPSTFIFSTIIPIRITDVNYGGHVGNDTILSLIHEGRCQFLQSFGFSEKDMAGVGLIMGDVAIAFKSELFYGDRVNMSITVTNLEKVTFDVLYKLEKEVAGKTFLVATAKTGMVCYDYERRKVVAVPEAVKNLWVPSPA